MMDQIIGFFRYNNPFRHLLGIITMALVIGFISAPMVTLQVACRVVDALSVSILTWLGFWVVGAMVKFVYNSKIVGIFRTLAIFSTVFFTAAMILLLSLFILWIATSEHQFHEVIYIMPARLVILLLALLLGAMVAGRSLLEDELSTLKDEITSDSTEDSPQSVTRMLPDTKQDHEPSASASPQVADLPLYFEKITVKKGQLITIINTSDIIAILAEGDYVMIMTASGKYIKEDTLKYFMTNLDPSKFVRVHRSSIINIDYISRIESYDKNSQMITTTNSLRVKTSANGYRELKKTLNL